jgi:TM2 domain-containing membrane protein YozV
MAVKNEEKHEKLIKMLLCLWLGTLGLHHFYMGNNTAGNVRLILTVCGVFTFGITTLIAVIWTWADFVNRANDKL